MDDLKFVRDRKRKVYLAVILVLLSLFVFAACNTQSEVVSNEEGFHVEQPGNIIAKFLMVLNDGIGNFGWTVVVFTIILKVAMSPLDFWQKHIMRKNAKAMERMKPKLEKLQKQYGNQRDVMQQKQMQLYKEEKYSIAGSCIPMIATMVIFFLVFNGFNKMVNFTNASEYAEMANHYQVAYDATIGDNPNPTDAEKMAAIAAGQAEVKQNYTIEGWLWINNVFVADSWKEAVPTYKTFTGSGLGNMNVKGVDSETYNNVMGAVLGAEGGYGYGKKGNWNGLLLLPLMAVALQFVSQRLTSKQQQQAQPPTPTGADGQPAAGAAAMSGANMKAMQYIMPLMFGVFALFYSSAFTIYMFTSSLFSVLFQIGYNLIAKQMDKKEEALAEAASYKSDRGIVTISKAEYEKEMAGSKSSKKDRKNQASGGAAKASKPAESASRDEFSKSAKEEVKEETKEEKFDFNAVSDMFRKKKKNKTVAEYDNVTISEPEEDEDDE